MTHEIGVPFTPEPDLELERENALDGIDSYHAETLSHLTGDATKEEVDTWPRKCTAAENYIADIATASQIKMITTEAALTGEDPLALANYIKARAEATDELIGLASGMRRKSRAAIKVAETVEQIDYILEAARAEGEAAIADLAKRGLI